MEDYIFLIIAIVLSIFGAINKNKKKKAADDLPDEPEEHPRNFIIDQLLGEDFLADEEPKPAPKPKVVRKPVIVQPQVRTPHKYQPSFVSGLPDRPKRTLKSSVAPVAVEEPEPETELTDQTAYLEDFSLRKAFIYSEILQRKYE